MKLPLYIEGKAEYYCRQIIESLERETMKGNVVTIQIPRIQQHLQECWVTNENVN